jgi:FkbM family methyltransferase
VRRALVLLARAVPQRATRALGRWLLRGPRRRRLRDRLAARVGGSGVVARGAAAGLRIDAAGSNPGYALGISEPAVQAELARALRPGAVFFDVGANVGFFTLIAARLVGPSGCVVAFEPLGENVAALRRNLAANGVDNVRVVPRALGRGAERLPLGGPPGEPDPALRARLSREPGAGGEPVDVAALDAVAAELALPAPDVVKIDVEGWEVEAIEGMTATLAAARPLLVVEVHDIPGERLPERVAAALADRGYACRQLPHDGGQRHVVAAPA